MDVLGIIWSLCRTYRRWELENERGTLGSGCERVCLKPESKVRWAEINIVIVR